MKRKMLNVRTHLEHIQMITEAYEKYGNCPLVEEELKKISFINKRILEEHNKKKALGNRKDIYINQ
jgi:hypothetical protein